MKSFVLLSWLGVASAATAQLVEPAGAPPAPPPVQHRELMQTQSLQPSDFSPATTLSPSAARRMRSSITWS